MKEFFRENEVRRKGIRKEFGMRFVIQRVTDASVTVEGEVVPMSMNHIVFCFCKGSASREECKIKANETGAYSWPGCGPNS